MNNMATPTAGNLQDLYGAWLTSPHPAKPDLSNAERSVSDRLNHRYSLECFAAGAGDAMGDWEGMSAAALDVVPMLLGRHVERGAQRLAERKGRKAPSEKTIKNLISCCKTLQALALDGKMPGQAGKSPRDRRRSRPKRRALPSFPQREWPQELVEQWPAFAAWKTKPVLTAVEGKRYRRQKARPITVQAHRERLNPYVGWLVRERHRQHLTLTVLADPELYAQYVNWVLEQPHQSGYSNARMTGIALAVLSRYLVAQGEIAEFTNDGQRIWEALYELSKVPMTVAAERGHLRNPKDVGDWKPWHLRELGIDAWNTEPIRRQRGNEGRWANQCMSRKRSALFFLLAHETPLRARNFVQMRWHRNLARQPDGRWRVSFSGDELKVGMRGFRTNTYERTYSAETSRYIEEWRQLLEQHLGPDFEQRADHVLPAFVHHGGKPGAIQAPAFARNVGDLCEELRGERFNLHKVRHITGTYFANEYGPAGLGIAAAFLGDRPETVMRAYYRPNTTADIETYLKRVQDGKLG